jgi:hypothetical protein
MSLRRSVLVVALSVPVMFITLQVGAASDVIRGKVGLEKLFPSYWTVLESKIMDAAWANADLEACGYRPEMERRATAAIEPCVKPESMARVRSLYAEQKAIEDKDLKGTDACSDPKDEERLRHNMKWIDETVRELERMCRYCWTCRGD